MDYNTKDDLARVLEKVVQNCSPDLYGDAGVMVSGDKASSYTLDSTALQHEINQLKLMVDSMRGYLGPEFEEHIAAHRTLDKLNVVNHD